ncbi:MAG: hypothetical protein Q9186_003484 [Xanthomendoza sp. 1 TL-2023]
MASPKEREAALLRRSLDRQGGSEDVALAREYIAAMHALDNNSDKEEKEEEEKADDTTILKTASLLCINSRRQQRNLCPLTRTELDERLDGMVGQVLDSVRDIDSTTTPEEIMERFNDELIGVTRVEREEFLVLDGWEVRERREWPGWVLEAFGRGDLRSDFWGTEVRRERRDLIGFFGGEMGGG